MSLYQEYMGEIATRKNDLGLNPKPIDSADLLAEIIAVSYTHLRAHET